MLTAQGLDQPRPEDVGVTPATLLVWYFEHCLKEPLPDDVDAAARERGFADRDHFYRAILREWIYYRPIGSGQQGDDFGRRPAENDKGR